MSAVGSQSVVVVAPWGCGVQRSAVAPGLEAQTHVPTHVCWVSAMNASSASSAARTTCRRRPTRTARLQAALFVMDVAFEHGGPLNPSGRDESEGARNTRRLRALLMPTLRFFHHVGGVQNGRAGSSVEDLYQVGQFQSRRRGRPDAFCELTVSSTGSRFVTRVNV